MVSGAPESWRQDGGSTLGRGAKLAYGAMALSVVVFLVIAWVAVAKTGNLGDDAVVGLVAALVPGVISVVVSAFGHLSQLRSAAERERARDQEANERERLRTAAEKERETIRYEEIVLKSLDFFTGNTQRRNVGIAIVEGAWDRAKHLRPVFVPLLVNQAVYLLEESGQTDSSHETQNLVRIMGLVMAASSSNTFPETMFQPLVAALGRRQVEGTSNAKGVKVSEDEAAGWLQVLTRAASP